ncbi:MAG: glycoside hydrolase family 127 protein, partial [Chlorobia bacterium]|nr:glycoside hydrolase family 127 protein [Fimbriimonadaceae bacterium]
MANLRSLPLSDIKINDPFWSRYHRELLSKGLLAQHDQLVKTDRLLNFQRVAKGETGGFEGFRFNDSDVYKWIEAVAYALHHGESPTLKSAMDEAIDIVASAQETDGYLNTYFQLNEPTMKWRNLHAMHEMYCAGHLIEAAVAVFESTGDRRLLEVGIKVAEHIASIFGPDKRNGSCGHEEIELALIKLAEVTGTESYRELARWMVEMRGRRPSFFEAELEEKDVVALSPGAAKILQNEEKYTGEYLQDHLPIREHEEVVGHAVRAMYLYIAAANLDPDPEMKAALERTWANLTKKRMYVTGGIGPSGDNEGFTTDYDLPNLTAYAETCAAVGLVFWGHALLQMTGNSEYADTIERALYNGAISGVSLETTHYFYDNPLESRGVHKRTPWFSCACCPSNIARLIGAVGRYAISVSDSAFWIHIPIGFEASTDLNGVTTKLALTSNYPWSGEVELSVDPESPVVAEIRFRIPEWADDVETEIPGLEEEAQFANGYIVIKKRWQKGDKAKFNLELKPKWVASDPRVKDNLGRVALTYGPLIYAAEEHDLGFAPQLFSVDTDA